MRTFEQFRKYIKENIPDPFKTKNGESPDFDKELKKTKSKGLKTYKQKSLDLYKAGGPFVPEKEVSQKTGKTVKMEKKPYFGKPTLPKRKEKAPDRTGLKKAISDVRASDKKLYDAGVGKKPSLVQQRKYTISRIKELSRKTTRQDAYNRAFGGGSGSTEGSAGASGSSKTVTPTKGVKQSEVSKQAKDFTKDINQKRSKKTFSNFAKEAEAAKDNLRKDADTIQKSKTLTGRQKKELATPVMKKVKVAQAMERGYKSPDTAKTSRAVVRTKDLDMVKSASKGTSVSGDDFKKKVEDTFKKEKAKAKNSKVTSSSIYGKYKDTARGQDILSKKATRLSRGFKGGTGKRAALGKFARSPLGKGLIGTTGKGKLVRAGLAVAGYYGAKAYLNRKDDLNINKDFAKTTTIKNPSGQNVRFKYSNKKDKDGNPIYKDQASSFLTKDKKNRIGGTIPGGLTKFRTGQYTANYKSGGKVGGRIDIDKNMRSSAFEKQLRRAEKGTGFLGKQTQKDKDFLRKYKNATRPTAVK
tara:strand:- start:21 stop:1598 length:1578 start_codon:yes stop_codon:yes gene_type:complete